MALTLFLIVQIRGVYRAFSASENVLFWDVEHRLLVDSYALDGWVVSVATHNAGRGQVVRANDSGR